MISLNLFKLQSSNNIISMIFDNRQTNFWYYVFFFLNIYTKNVLRALKIKGFKLLIKKYQIVQMYGYQYNINKKIAKISPSLIMI